MSHEQIMVITWQCHHHLEGTSLQTYDMSRGSQLRSSFMFMKPRPVYPADLTPMLPSELQYNDDGFFVRYNNHCYVKRWSPKTDLMKLP